MALSTYCKMGALENLSSEAELLSYSNNFDLHPLFHEDQQVLPYLSSQWDPLNISLSEILTVPQDFDPQSSYYYPKRQKCYGNEYNFSDFTPTLFDGFLPPMPDSYHVECSKKMMNERSVSAQSIAARERRRKISEKTQELGRLIPGGNRMNTAEMFHAASKYLKFLQAQLGILQLMPSIIFQEINGASPRAEVQAILASPSVQEKLYLEEKCLVPKELAKMLAKDCDIQSNPSISNDLNQLVRSEN